MWQPPADLAEEHCRYVLRRAAGWVAVLLTVCVVALLGATGLHLGMEWRNATPRLNSLTIALGLVPPLGISLIVFLWSPPRPPGGAATTARVLGTLVALAVGGWCLVTAFVLMFFAG